MVEWVKMVFIELNAQNILIPWIYLFYNPEFHEVCLPMISVYSNR